MSGLSVLVLVAVNLLLVQSVPVPVPIEISDISSAGAKQGQQSAPSKDAFRAHQEQEAEFKRQAQNARYQFATQMSDNINGNFQQRAEIREGTKVYGKYSYDDGFSWRTVYYQADEDGFRVIREEVAPSQMKADVDGDVTVQISNDGNSVNYHITKKDIATRKQINQQQYGFASQYGRQR